MCSPWKIYMQLPVGMVGQYVQACKHKYRGYCQIYTTKPEVVKKKKIREIFKMQTSTQKSVKV